MATSILISTAMMPASTKKTKPERMYMIPMSVWWVVVIHRLSQYSIPLFFSLAKAIPCFLDPVPQQ